jgi:hypothetical protein
MFLSFQWRCTLSWAMASSFLGFLDPTQWHITFSRPPQDEWSAHRRDLYLTIHNTHNRQTSVPLAGFKPEILASKQLQTYTLDCEASETGTSLYSPLKIIPSSYMESHFDWNTFNSCIDPSKYCWYSVLLHDGLFQPKHVATKLYVYNEHF